MSLFLVRDVGAPGESLATSGGGLADERVETVRSTSHHGHPCAESGRRQRDLHAARLLPTRLGLSPEDLLTTPAARPTMPTFREYIPIVSAAVTDDTRRVYGSYRNRIDAHGGHRPLDEPTPSESNSWPSTWRSTSFRGAMPAADGEAVWAER